MRPKTVQELPGSLVRFGGHVASALDCSECQINTATQKGRYFVDELGEGFVQFLDESPVAARPRNRRTAL